MKAQCKHHTLRSLLSKRLTVSWPLIEFSMLKLTKMRTHLLIQRLSRLTTEWSLGRDTPLMRTCGRISMYQTREGGQLLSSSFCSWYVIWLFVRLGNTTWEDTSSHWGITSSGRISVTWSTEVSIINQLSTLIGPLWMETIYIGVNLRVSMSVIALIRSLLRVSGRYGPMKQRLSVVNMPLWAWEVPWWPCPPVLLMQCSRILAQLSSWNWFHWLSLNHTTDKCTHKSYQSLSSHTWIWA